jgi:hypothetical protein
MGSIGGSSLRSVAISDVLRCQTAHPSLSEADDVVRNQPDAGAQNAHVLEASPLAMIERAGIAGYCPIAAVSATRRPSGPQQDVLCWLSADRAEVTLQFAKRQLVNSTSDHGGVPDLVR